MTPAEEVILHCFWRRYEQRAYRAGLFQYPVMTDASSEVTVGEVAAELDLSPERITEVVYPFVDCSARPRR